MSNVYTIKDAEITLTMPDGSTSQFTLEAPTAADNSYWFRVVAEAPGGELIYKDPSRTRQKAFADYYLEFHFSYAHHRMFTTMLLVAVNIALKTVPPFDTPLVTNVLLRNEEAVKNYLAGMPVRNAAGDVVPSGQAELVFISKTPMSWQEALGVDFYV